MEVAATLASAGKLTLVVLQLTIKDLAVARGLLVGLSRRGVAGEAVVPLVNRYRRRSGLVGLEEARRVLGTTVAYVDNDYKNALRAINHGQPLSQAAPRSRLRRSLQEFVNQVVLARVGGVPKGR